MYLSRRLRFLSLRISHTIRIHRVCCLAITLNAQPLSHAMSKQTFNICTIGQNGHGKTTLSKVVNAVMRTVYGQTEWTETEKGTDSVENGVVKDMTMSVFRARFESSTRRYHHIDVSRKDQGKMMIAGATQMDAAILVVSASEGVGEETSKRLVRMY